MFKTYKICKDLSRVAILLGFLFSISLSFGQVGIGTTEPERMLDVNGSLLVEYGPDLGIQNLIAADESGVLTNIELDPKLVLTNGRLSTAAIMTFGMKTIPWVRDCNGTDEIDLLDLSINPGEANEKVIVFKLGNVKCNTTINSIKGGIDGRHIFLYMAGATGNTNLYLNNMAGAVGNQIDTLTGNQVSIEGRGVLELIYDGDKQKWIVISIIR